MKSLIFVYIIGFFTVSFGQTTNSIRNESGNSQNQLDSILPPTAKSNVEQYSQEELKINESREDKDSQKNELFHQLNSDFIRLYEIQNQSIEQRNATALDEFKMNADLSKMQEIAPFAFETNLNLYLVNHYNPDFSNQLFYAAQLSPKQPTILKNLAIYYQLYGSVEHADSIVEQLKNEAVYSENYFLYCSDLLASCIPNSTLIVHGIDDFIPVAYLNSKHPEQKITIISLELLQSKAYQEQLTTKGFVFPKDSIINPEYLSTFLSLNSTRYFQLSMTIPSTYFKQLLPNIAACGLTFSSANTASENYAWNDQLWQQKWNKNRLIQPTNDRCDGLSSNFLPALIQLEKQYERLGKTNEATELKQVIQQIAMRSQKTATLKSIHFN